MTQEEKAKRYDELLLKLQKAKVDDNVCDEMYYRVIDDIVPELKESEDEKIRKWLIGYFNQYINDGMPQVFSNGLNVKDVIAWLEKQDRQKQETSYPKFDFDDILALQCCMETAEKVTEDKELYKKLQSLHSKLHDAYWIEKQGEQKQDPCEHCADKRLNCHNFPCVKKRAFKQGKSALEVINEEPQVYDTEDGEIITYSETDGYKFYQPKFKDGDVLNSPSHHLIWIYKDNEHFYACVNMNYVTKNVATNGLISIPNDARPATKEQREQLEKAMADAGYAFNFEKKELKKVEQNPAVWSKIDDANLEGSIYFIKEFRRSTLCDTESRLQNSRTCIEWLASLKDRVQPQSKQEWSEEDERQWNNIYDVLDGHFELSEKGYKNAANWLKSLKRRYTWKPSDEQMKVLLSEVTGWKKGCSKQKVLESLYQDLKKLK